jgi:uncharacterized protein (DUF2062 family)
VSNPIRNVALEAAAFRAAYEAAPAPAGGAGPFGLRHLVGKLVHLLLHEHTSPRELAISVFVGTLVGVSPFYGFHVLACVVLSFAFRLNKLATWVASNVSLPFFAPFLGFASVQVGHLMLNGRYLPMDVASFRARLGEPWAFLVDVWQWWMVGFLPVGAFLGAALGGATGAVARRRAAQRLRLRATASSASGNVVEAVPGASAQEP